MGRHLETILKQMCKYVNAPYESMDFKANNWYWQYEWTEDQENEFKKWLYKYIKNDNSARKELFTFNINNKHYVEKWVNNFIGNYGWKTKNMGEN